MFIEFIAEAVISVHTQVYVRPHLTQSYHTFCYYKFNLIVIKIQLSLYFIMSFKRENLSLVFMHVSRFSFIVTFILSAFCSLIIVNEFYAFCFCFSASCCCYCYCMSYMLLLLLLS